MTAGRLRYTRNKIIRKAVIALIILGFFSLHALKIADRDVSMLNIKSWYDNISADYDIEADDAAISLTQGESESVEHFIARIEAKRTRAKVKFEKMLYNIQHTSSFSGIEKSLKKSEKCQRYFNNLYTSDPEWTNDYRTYKFLDVVNETISSKLIVERLRVYEECQVNDFYGSDVESYSKMDERMFPFINSRGTPIFYNAGKGSTLEDGEVPVFHSGSHFTHEHNENKSWIDNWRQIAVESSNNRTGIVMTVGNSQISFALRLLSVLDHQDDNLPIQIIHKGDLSSENMQKLTSFKPRNRELWLVDVSTMINPGYINDFSGFKNKWLALILNTFQEFVFIDVDAISIAELNQYFTLPQYMQTGTLFFKDRDYDDKTEPHCIPMISNFDVTKEEQETFTHTPKLTDISALLPLMNHSVIQSYFLSEKKHQMDSGLMVINKNMHIMALLCGMFLNLLHSVSKCGHGDKEFVWLGFLLQGHPFQFHELEASAVGEYHNGDDSLCSIQLAHTSSSHKLLWLNGGFKNCKFDNAAALDWDSFAGDKLRNQFATQEEAQAYYSSEIKINSAVAGPHLWAGGYGDLCIGYLYCAFIDKSKQTLIEFDKEELNKIQGISNIWYSYNGDPVYF